MFIKYEETCLDNDTKTPKELYSSPGQINAVHLEQNEANYFRPHYCIIFQ